MTLGEYLRSAAATPWKDGEHDCCMFPANWVQTWGKGDPAAQWRGTYRTEAEARAIIERAGGIDRLWSTGLASIGIPEVETPQEGDVGIIWALGRSGPEQVGAIYVGPRWSMLTQRGVFSSRVEIVRVWGPR